MRGRFLVTRSSRRNSTRRGAAAIEMAITLPIFILIVLGIVEFGRALMVNQILVNAAREGARHAVVPGASDSQVNGIVDNYMSAAGISGYSKAIKINGSEASLSTASPDDTISVSVSVAHSQVSWGIISAISSGRQFGAEVQMRKE